MKLKVVSYTPEQAKEILSSQLKKAADIRRKNYEMQWLENESLLFKNGKGPINATLSYDSLAEVFAKQSADGTGMNRIHVPQVARNLRILHSQLSANPPSAIAEPLSNETEDQYAAKVANHLISYGINEYGAQEQTDQWTLSSQVYGTGFLKVVYDGTKGDLLKHNTSTDEVEMTGDIDIKPALVWNIFIDPDAERWKDVRYVYERIFLSYPEACSMFPEYIEDFKRDAVDTGKHPRDFDGFVTQRLDYSNQDVDLSMSMIPIFAYYEKAMPINGMAGRHCFCLKDGTVLGEMKASPVPNGKLPYVCLTDIDVPGEVYGKTPVDYAISLSAVVDAMDNMILENVEIHGSLHLVVFDGSEINESDLTDTPVDIIRVNGVANQAPFHLSPPPLTGDIYNLRNSKLQEIDAIMGVNEALKGQVPRELSGFALQTAMNAANMARRRLYNKYTKGVQDMWTLYLDAVATYWTTKRKVLITGVEDAAKVAYYSGADLNGGFNISCSYGQMFSLDPAQRRQELLQAQPILEKAGVSPKKIARELKYQEVDPVFDAIEIAENRQYEIFEQMIASYHETGEVKYIPASNMEVAYHAEMAEAGYQYVMKRYFLDQPAELKQAIYQHIREREQMAAEQAAPQQPAQEAPAMPGAPAAPAGPGGAPVVPDMGAVL